MDTSTAGPVRLESKDVKLDALLASAQGGDEAALASLIAILSPRLVAALRGRLCRDEDTAASVVQDAWLAAWQKLKRFDSGAHLRQWMYRVIRNIAVSRFRRQCSLHKALRAIGPTVAARQHEGELCNLDDLAATARSRKLLAALPRIYREVSVLFYIHGRSTIEISFLLGISRAAVKMRLHRARRYLRELLASR